MSKTVLHPTIPDVSYVVDDSAASSWKDAGWRFTDPTTDTKEATPTPKATDSK